MSFSKADAIFVALVVQVQFEKQAFVKQLLSHEQGVFLIIVKIES